MMFETIQCEVRAGVAQVRLAPPTSANAINPAFSREFREIMVAAQVCPWLSRASKKALVNGWDSTLAAGAAPGRWPA